MAWGDNDNKSFYLPRVVEGVLCHSREEEDRARTEAYHQKKKNEVLERKKKADLEAKQKQEERTAKKLKDAKEAEFRKRRQALYGMNYDELFGVDPGATAPWEEQQEKFEPPIQLDRQLGGKSKTVEEIVATQQKKENKQKGGSVSSLKITRSFGGAASGVYGANNSRSGFGGGGDYDPLDPFQEPFQGSGSKQSGSSGGGMKRSGF